MISLQTSETPPENRRHLPKQAALVDASANNASTRAAWTLPRREGRPRSWCRLRCHGRRVVLGEGCNRIVLDRRPELSVECRVRHKVRAHGLGGRGHEGPGIGGQLAELADE